MTDFFVDGEFYNSLDELMEDLGVDVEYDLESGLDVLEDDWHVKAYEAKAVPLMQFNTDILVGLLTDHLFGSFPEDDNDQVYDMVVAAIKAGIDVDKINSLMPNVWRPTKNKFTITKADIIKYIG